MTAPADLRALIDAVIDGAGVYRGRISFHAVQRCRSRMMREQVEALGVDTDSRWQFHFLRVYTARALRDGWPINPRRTRWLCDGIVFVLEPDLSVLKTVYPHDSVPRVIAPKAVKRGAIRRANRRKRRAENKTEHKLGKHSKRRGEENPECRWEDAA